MDKKNVFSALLLRDQPLMVKLTVYSALLVVIPMMLVGWISYRESTRALENEAKQYSWQIIELVKLYVEDYLRDFELSTLRMVNHPDTVAFLKMTSLEEASDADLAPAVRNVLKNAAYSRSDVTNITLILDGVQTISSTDGRSSVLGIEEEYWYAAAPLTGRPKVYGRIIEWNGRREPVLSIVKRIGNPMTLEPYGMLVIDINYKRLHEIAREVKLGESGRGYLFILDEQGRFVYHPNPNLIGMKAAEEVTAAIGQETSGSFVLGRHRHQQLLTFSRSESLGWQVVTAIPYRDMMNSRNYIGRTIGTITAVSALIALLLSIGLAASIVKPIKRIYQYMKRVEIGDLKRKLPVDRSDEIGKLSIGFNTMVDRLSELLEEVYFSKLRETEMHLRQREMELKMLQAQINPHFLYNSLDTIRGMALAAEISEIEAMASALARLLRYNIKDASAAVTVREEVDMVEVYLRIQQFRFEEKLEYSIDIPEWAMKQHMLKFTLQPIVENAIVHALETRLEVTRIELSAQRTGEKSFAVRIRDNGPGIPQEKIAELRRRLDDGKAEGQHIGLTNVHRRICHVFGDGEFGLTLNSTEGEGTEVLIRLPYDASCEEDDHEERVSGVAG